MKRTSSSAETHIIILIDGECPLCHRLARFVSKRDAAGRFRFAALQSAAGRRLLAEGGQLLADGGRSAGRTEAPDAAHLETTNGYTADTTNTFVLLKNGRYYIKSTAALQVLRKLDGLWPLLYGAIVLPAFIRDCLYDRIARSRYRLFGRGPSLCELPDVRLRERLITDEGMDES